MLYYGLAGVEKSSKANLKFILECNNFTMKSNLTLHFNKFKKICELKKPLRVR